MSKKRVVFFTGAGISAESGLSIFRGAGGLWNNYKLGDIASPEAWVKNPSLVLDFYNQRRQTCREAKPNLAHTLIFDLEEFYNINVITQNIDDLHERSGSRNILHLHGEIMKKKSEQNFSIIELVHDDIKLGDFAKDGSQYRPHVVWFGEPVIEMEKAISICKNAEIFVVIGTSLQVYPAATCIEYVPSHSKVFFIDKNPAYIARREIQVFETTATEGMQSLYQMLLQEA